MWNIENMKIFRAAQNLEELNQKDLEDIVDVLNDMKKDTDKIQALEIEPFFEFSPTAEG
ncbi:MAG: hypothetical protein R3331_03735 [Sulfurospirillaceae bacterium]|nr:hypothetical protein [Sulfurospirillaceae bacterium]